MKKHCVRYGYVISLILLVFMTIFFSVRSYHLGKYEGAFSQAEVTVLNDVWTKTPDVSESGDKDSYLVYSYTTKNEEPRHQVLAIESYWMMMEVFVGENKVFVKMITVTEELSCVGSTFRMTLPEKRYAFVH